MEQEKKHKPFGALLGGIAGVTALCLLLSCALWGSGRSGEQQEDAVSAGAFSGQSTSTRRLIPMGKAVGIKLFSDGVLVVGLSTIDTAAGAAEPGKESGLKTGDVITHINGLEVDTIEAVQDMLAEQEGAVMTIRALRGEQALQLSAKPAENSLGNYQLGVWLRDSMAGIGTMSFYDPDSGMFAALGHGINDVDTSMLMPLESGSIMEASISDVKKGLSGDPGELHGTFNLQTDLGELYSNTELGIFGLINGDSIQTDQQPMEVATRSQVKTGAATILSNIRGDEVEEFDIEITHVNNSSGNICRTLTVQVTDPDLLETTGGIVQGMSGSPIIQNGKLVGAVTHVLINDPTKGYGILVENMLASSAQLSQTQAS